MSPPAAPSPGSISRRPPPGSRSISASQGPSPSCPPRRATARSPSPWPTRSRSTTSLGSSYDDTIIGNADDNTLIGGGGDDEIAGLGGNDLLEGAVTRTVYLDFDTYELPGQHYYTQAERDAIQAQITADYSAFSYDFTQTQPQSGPYTTIVFNDPTLVGLEGGVATEIDWRDLDISGTTTLTAYGLEVVPPDSGGVNVNNFLGGPGEPAATSADFIGLSATIAAHELGHLSGLEHADSFGPIGSGIYSGVNPNLYNPAYPGPTDANETIDHIMASGASVNSTLEDALNDPFFGEREAIALSYGEDGSPTNEQIAPHYSMADAQPIALEPLTVPDTDLEGVNADQVFNVTAADVVGYLGETGGASNTDYYSFTAQAGTLISFQVMSVALTRNVAPPGTPATDYNQGPFDTYLVIFNSSGQVIEYNDNSFQDADSSIIDLTLPYTGTYYAMVTSSPNSVSLKEPLTGDYELFMYTFATAGDPPAGDSLYAGSGDDTIVAGTADDTIAPLPQDTIIYGSGTVELLKHAPYLNVSAGPNQVVDEGTPVTLTGSFLDPEDGETQTYDWHVVASSGQQIADGYGPSFTFTPGNAGTYTVTYTVMDPNGGSGSAQVVITSNDVPPGAHRPHDRANRLRGREHDHQSRHARHHGSRPIHRHDPLGRRPDFDLLSLGLRLALARPCLCSGRDLHGLRDRVRTRRRLHNGELLHQRHRHGAHVDDAHLVSGLGGIRPVRVIHRDGGRQRHSHGHRYFLRWRESDRHGYPERGQRPGCGHLQHLCALGPCQPLCNHSGVWWGCQRSR